jgi:hypothetical protein
LGPFVEPLYSDEDAKSYQPFKVAKLPFPCLTSLPNAVNPLSLFPMKLFVNKNK